MSPQKGFISIILLVVIAAAVLGIGGYVALLLMPQYSVVNPDARPGVTQPVVCTQEAKQCPDGSYVGRTGPSCEFAECPNINPPYPICEYAAPPSGCNYVQGPNYNKESGCGLVLHCKNQCNVQPDQYGNCPNGCVNYGIPLGCVTPEYSDYCKTHPCPICLAENTLIDTPSGQIAVQSLKEGMLVWATDEMGNKISAAIIKTSKTPVPKAHHMVHVILEDGRQVLASPGHPIGDGRVFNDLAAGDVLSGSIITTAKKTTYDKGYTYDILPSGATGLYFANGILIGSTLK